jgi:hypothetical protein
MFVYSVSLIVEFFKKGTKTVSLQLFILYFTAAYHNYSTQNVVTNRNAIKVLIYLQTNVKA